MMKKIPFADPSPGRNQPDESKPPELGSVPPKATFHWPPDCAWPFINRDGTALSELISTDQRKITALRNGGEQFGSVMQD
jgi:hypothetical protein